MQAHDGHYISLEEIFYALPESVYAKDKAGRYIACSRRAAQMTGYDNPKEIIGKTDHELFWSEYADEICKNDKRVIETAETQIFEERGHTIYPGVVMVRTIKSPLFDEDEEVCGIVGISVDVSDMFENSAMLLKKMAADQAIQRTESSFLKSWYQEVSGQEIKEPLSLDDIANRLKTYMEGIIDKLPANVYWMDANGIMLGCNQQMAAVLGLKDRHELIGKDFNHYYAKVNGMHCMDNNLAAIKSGGVLVFEETVELDGEARTFLSHKSALRDPNGEPISLLGVSFDITERKRIERELKIAKEEAEAANLAKLHFMNNMRHDLRTPLSCVVGSARILKAMENDPQKAEFIEGILKSSQHLLQMLTNMLEFNHIQSKEKTVEFKSVKIIELGRDLIDMLSLTAKGKNIGLSLEVLPGTPEILLSDGYRLQRVLMNLLNNAIKFTHRGSVVLRFVRHGEALHISVQDTGIGIASEYKDEVFEKFVRLIDADKGIYEGEGLGLAIVKQFVEELNGQIELHSEVEVGSTFTIVLPLLQLAREDVTKGVYDESIIS